MSRTRMGFIAWVTLVALVPFSLGSASLPFSRLALAQEPSPSPAASPQVGPKSPKKTLPKKTVTTRIPARPSAPPPLAPQERPHVFTCQRRFIYQGQDLECDSILSRDAENLRPVIQDVPEAANELDAYQSGRRSVRTLAYVGTLGILTMITGVLLSRGKNSLQAVAQRNILVGGGLIITAGSLSAGLGILESNEGHLMKAVENYNQARPNDPITLKFSTGVNF